MDSRVAAELIPPVYEDFDPSSELVYEKDFDTIILNLPGFRKDHLKVQLTTSKILRISGSRLAEGNKWRRFQKEFPVTPGRDPSRISAKFEGGFLYVKVPMLIPTPGKKEENKQDNKRSQVTTSPEKVPADQQPADRKDSDKEQPTDDKSARKNDPSAIAKEEPEEKKVEPADSEKKDKKSPEDKRSNAGDKHEEQEKAKKSPEEKTGGLEDNKKQNTTEKPEDDKVKNKPEEKSRGLVDDSKDKKSVAGDDEKREDDNSKKATEKREKESPETVDHASDKTQAENQNLASKLKKHRRMFNLALVAILAIALGLYVTDLFNSLRRTKN